MSHLDAISIPDKTYFKIGEVAKLLDLEPYVLRYWESEFDVLDPDKTDSGQRIYQRDDIELIFQIRELLYSEMFTIAGARRQLELEREGKPNLVNPEVGAESDQVVELQDENTQLREQLDELRARLEEKDDVQTDMWEAQLAAQKGEVERLERDLSEATEMIARLEEKLADSQLAEERARGIDPRIVQGLREQLQGLARAAQRPV